MDILGKINNKRLVGSYQALWALFVIKNPLVFKLRWYTCNLICGKTQYVVPTKQTISNEQISDGLVWLVYQLSGLRLLGLGCVGFEILKGQFRWPVFRWAVCWLFIVIQMVWATFKWEKAIYNGLAGICAVCECWVYLPKMVCSLVRTNAKPHN